MVKLTVHASTLAAPLIASVVACGFDPVASPEPGAPKALASAALTSGSCVRPFCVHRGGSDGDPPPPPIHLQYYGGRLIANPRVVEVLYGAGGYIPELTTTAAPSVASFYHEMLSSGVFDWLKEYNTSSPPHSIGRGDFYGRVQIAPDASRNDSTITDAQIQAELSAQITAGVLPAPDDQLIYMVHFPAGKSLVSEEGSASCVPDGFCAYHGTYQRNGRDVFYAVLPDLGSGLCSTVCGNSTAFNNQTAVASHELIETITDPEIGLTDLTAVPYVPSAPDAWFDPYYDEIGDICAYDDATFTGHDGFTYLTQKEYSNQAGSCILTRATAPNTTDLVWRTTDGAVSLWLMHGGVWQGSIGTGSPDTGWTIQGAGDFDGDGKSDLFWRCTGASCFQTTHGQLAIWYSGQMANPVPSYPGLVSDDGWRIKGFGDFDGNGQTDVLWQYAGQVNHGQLAVWGNGQSTSPTPWYPALVGDDGWRIQGIGDFDGDGRSDILWRYAGTTNHGQLAIWWGAQNASPPPTYPTAVPDDSWQIKGIGDFNGDGRSDILWQYAGAQNHGQLAIWFNGQYVNPPAVYPGRQSDDTQVILGVGDFDGDNRSDVLWRHTGTTSHGELEIWWSAQSASPPPSFPPTVPDTLVLQTTGHFD